MQQMDLQTFLVTNYIINKEDKNKSYLDRPSVSEILFQNNLESKHSRKIKKR